jgi:phage terminase small subunit
MPPLHNPRWENFCQELFKGSPASAAYEAAGYSFNEGNAIRLKGNEKVKARLSELQLEAQKSSEVTVQSLMAELDNVLTRATTKEQYAAAVGALREKIKLSGLLVQKIEVGEPHSFEDLNSVPDIIARLKDLVGPQATELFCICFGVDENGVEGVKPDSSASYRRKLARFKARQAQRVIEHDPNEQPRLDPVEIERKKMIADRNRTFNGGNGRQR